MYKVLQIHINGYYTQCEPPVPIQKWNVVYDATKDGPACPQPNIQIPDMSEDCLFLNIYSTKLPNKFYNPKRPVIFYLHPGGLHSSTARSDWAGPQYLLDQDVVLVTINNRLGALGLLSTGDCVAPGNNAFKDQVLALKWVKEHISEFGGNPDLVTLLGNSAGALGVSLHLVSPMSRGLFQRGIMMGASLYGRVFPTDQRDLANEVARIVGCPDDTSTNILECLKTKSAAEIANTLNAIQRDGFSKILMWHHVWEPVCGQERFLSADATTTMECKTIVDVPIMTGVTFDEFAAFGYFTAANETLITRLDKNFDNIAPYIFIYEHENDPNHISRELRRFYFGSGPLSSESAENLGKLYADAITGHLVNRAAVAISSNSKKPVYYYRFDFQGRFSLFYMPGTTTPFGVAHGDDAIYLLHTSALYPLFNQTDPEFKMMLKYTKLMANFALFGNPTPTASPLLDYTVWEPYNLQTRNYLQINKKLIMDTNFFRERYELWDQLFPRPKCTA